MIIGRSPEGEIFEGHRDYLDIHIAADGCEYLCCAPAEELQVKEAYSREGDCCLYTGKPKVRFLMGEGDFGHMLSGGCPYAQSKYRKAGICPKGGY